MSNDPFAEEEVTYTGTDRTPLDDDNPGPDTQDDNPAPDAQDGNHNAAEQTDAYDLDGDEVDEFDFDDEPRDWQPVVTPDAKANRTASVADTTPPAPERPAHRNGAGDTYSVPAEEASSAPAAPAPSPTPSPAPAPQPRHVNAAPDLPTKTNRSFKDRLLSLFRGKQAPVDNDEIRSLQRSINGTINVAVINRKGGVGKTLTTTLAGMTLADRRSDRIIAVDASPEGGELCDRVEREQYGSVRSLINQLDAVHRYSHVRTHTSQDATGLEVLGSDPDAVGEPELTADEYRAMMKVLRTYYPFIITDCAQGLNTPVMEAVLEEADVLMLVSEGADGMRSATWVASQLADDRGRYGGKFSHLVDDMIVVVTQRSKDSNVDMSKVSEHFRTIARKVIELPYDQALEGGRPFTLDEVEQSTRQAGLDIATAITTSQAFQEGGR